MSASTRAQKWSLVADMIQLTIGAVLMAIGVIVFQIPAKVAPGGVSGVAVMLNYLIPALPVGLMILIGNVPIQILAYRMLGGWRSIASTVYVVFVNALMIDLLTPHLGAVSDNRLLNALYGGIIGGIGGGLVFRGGGTAGGTSTLGRILQQRFGIPLSGSTLYTDTAVVVLAGIVFDWEGALLAMVALWVYGAVSDYVLEGPSVIRTAVIVTDHPKEVAAVILTEMGRGVTSWQARGMYTEQEHTILYVTVLRPQINRLRELVLSTDPKAFMVIGQGHTAYGHGFRELRPPEAE